MNHLTGPLLNCINGRHSGSLILTDGTTVPFTLIQGIDGGSNTVTYLDRGSRAVHSIHAELIAAVRVDQDEVALDGADLVRRSAALRGAGRFDDAIALIEGSLDQVDPDIRVNGLLEVFNAAREKGDMDVARKYAMLIAAEEPDLPSIKPFLG